MSHALPPLPEWLSRKIAAQNARNKSAALSSALGKVGVLLDFSSATVTGSGYSSVPDLKGGSPAVQATDARRPVNATSNNGLAIATFTDDHLALPLSAGCNGTIKWGMACYIKLANTTGNKAIASIQSVAGGANVNKLSVDVAATEIRIIDQTGGRRAQSGTLDTSWRFVYVGVDCSKGTEATQVIEAVDTTFQTINFNSDTAWAASLAVATGNMLIGATTTAGSSQFAGSIGSHVYFLTEQLTLPELKALASLKRPT